jgi:enolase
LKVRTFEARRIFNSAGKPSVEVSVLTEDGVFTSSVPHGTSTGSHEAKFADIERSVALIKKMRVPDINAIIDIESFERKNSKSGANMLALSLALLKALAASRKKEVWQLLSSNKREPLLLCKIIGGGVHANSGLEFQEFLAIGTSKSLAKNLEAAYAMDEYVGKNLHVHGRDLEGGWVVNTDNARALKVMRDAAKYAKSKTGVTVRLGVDIAASSFYKNGKYVYSHKTLSREEQIEFVLDLIKEFKLLYVEDPLQENDFKGFAKIKRYAKKAMICGDDLLTTNPARLEIAHKKNAVNSVIVKPNQVGYLYKLNKFIQKSREYGYNMVVSHRSQETSDDIIADLCVGFGCGYMKIGIFGSERLAKINRLLQIFKE